MLCLLSNTFILTVIVLVFAACETLAAKEEAEMLRDALPDGDLRRNLEKFAESMYGYRWNKHPELWTAARDALDRGGVREAELCALVKRALDEAKFVDGVLEEGKCGLKKGVYGGGGYINLNLFERDGSLDQYNRDDVHQKLKTAQVEQLSDSFALLRRLHQLPQFKHHKQTLPVEDFVDALLPPLIALPPEARERVFNALEKRTEALCAEEIVALFRATIVEFAETLKQNEELQREMKRALVKNANNRAWAYQNVVYMPLKTAEGIGTACTLGVFGCMAFPYVILSTMSDKKLPEPVEDVAKLTALGVGIAAGVLGGGVGLLTVSPLVFAFNGVRALGRHWASADARRRGRPTRPFLQALEAMEHNLVQGILNNGKLNQRPMQKNHPNIEENADENEKKKLQSGEEAVA